MRRAHPADAPALAACLARHPEGSMFPRANLARHGLARHGSGPSDHPHATRFRITSDPRSTVRAAYLTWTLSETSDRAAERAERNLSPYLAADSRRVLWSQGRAVALHLTQARAAGKRRACLFAASQPAVRAYRALCFADADSVALVLFQSAEVVAWP